MDPTNPFESLVHALKADQQRVTELESGISTVLQRSSTLQLDRSHGVRDVIFTKGDVDKLLRTSYRLCELGVGIETGSRPSDVAIEIARNADGSVVVFPALAA
jgi:hypothetical protein